MALADKFPTTLINTANLVITRFTAASTWADDTGVASTILSATSAIVIEGRKLRRGANNEDLVVTAEIYVPASVAAVANIREGDRAAWSGVMGSRTDQEILAIDRVSGVAGLEHWKLSIRERGGSVAGT